MLLVLDVGNTNIKVGLFKGNELLHSWRNNSDVNRTADEYGVQFESFFAHLKLDTRAVKGIIMCSVIPSMNFTIEHMCRIYFPGRELMQVHHKLKTGFNNRYDYPEVLGADRICNAAAAYKLYGGPCITVDFGTATTFGVLSKDGDFLGGAICPGFRVAVDALIERTAMLPKVQFSKPPVAIARNTEHAIQAGVIHGYVGQVEYLVDKIRTELGAKAKVIGTGGMSELIASESDCIDLRNPTLTLQGLAYIYELNN